MIRPGMDFRSFIWAVNTEEKFLNMDGFNEVKRPFVDVFSCPVCGTIYELKVPEYCRTCSWNLSVFPELIDESERMKVWEKEQIRLHWARQVWQNYQSVFEEFYKVSQAFSGETCLPLIPTKIGQKKSGNDKISKKSLQKKLEFLQSKVETDFSKILDYLEEIRLTNDRSFGLILEKLEGVITTSSQQEVWSEVGIDYQPLIRLLSTEKWKKADGKTWEILLQIAGREEEGWLGLEEISHLPVTDLRTIDYLWQYYSQGHFGLGIQSDIWKSVHYDYAELCERVGWLDRENWKYYEELSFNLKSPVGQLPILAWRKRSCYGVGAKMATDLFAIWMEKWEVCVNFSRKNGRINDE